MKGDTRPGRIATLAGGRAGAAMRCGAPRRTMSLDGQPVRRLAGTRGATATPKSQRTYSERPGAAG